MATFGLIACRPANAAMYERGTRYAGEAASQSFKKGEWLMLVNGLATEYAGTGLVCGIALHDASGTTSKRVDYIPVRAGDEVYMSLNDTIAVSDLGATYGWAVSSDKSVIDRDDTSDELTIVELTGLQENPFHPVAAIGDTNVVVRAVINVANHIDG